MATIQELVRTQQEQIRISQNNNARMIGLNGKEAYAQYFPTWEVTAPQYQAPTAYSLVQMQRFNEIAYSCINLWMNSIGEAPLRVYDKKSKSFIAHDEWDAFIEEPCPGVSEEEFHKANQMYLKITGGMAWEFDLANDGSLLHVWPMMPQYCSYMRGEGKLLRAIRYQPYTGMPYADIPAEKVVSFMYPDPMYYGLKPLGPTARLTDIITVDTDMTKVIGAFLKNGAWISGFLKTDQMIDKDDANFAKDQWRESKGGPEHAGEVAVLGKGLEFMKANNTFREMVLPELDARNEVRICMTYEIKPILVSAKVGMDRSTMNNYKEARQSQYEEQFTSEWRYISSAMNRQVFRRHFSQDPNLVLRFDVSEISALQENRNDTWRRATEAYKNRIIPRNGALKEMGLDPLPDGDPLAQEYYQTVLSQSSTTNSLDVEDNSQLPEEPKNKVTAPTDEQKTDERKNFIAFAKRRIKENKRSDIPEFEFKYLDDLEQRRLLNEYNVPDAESAAVLQALLAVVQSNKSASMQSPVINLTANIEPGKAPEVTVHNQIPEQKAAAQPAPIVNVTAPAVNINVDPTPIQNNIEVKTPRKKREVQRVQRDPSNNIAGTVTDIEYQE